MADIIDRAEVIIHDPLATFPRGLAMDLIAALKSAREEIDSLKSQLVIADTQYAEKP